MKNVVLVGMPGSGKSTLGVLLAEQLCYKFTDTDILITHKAQMPLQEIINGKGLNYFLSFEEEIGCQVHYDGTVIATGGSMILSNKAMQNLKNNGIVVYINVPLDEIERRVNNVDTRGIAFKKGETLADIYEQRTPLYQKYADVTVDFSTESVENTVKKIKDKVIPLIK